MPDEISEAPLQPNANDLPDALTPTRFPSTRWVSGYRSYVSPAEQSFVGHSTHCGGMQCTLITPDGASLLGPAHPRDAVVIAGNQSHL